MDLKLTKNEKSVLRILLDNGRASDINIAHKLGISSQAVGKIRKKLETRGVIEGYSVNLNFENMGVNTFALIYTDVSPKFLKTMSSEGFSKLYSKTQQSLVSARLIASDYNFVGINGFRDQIEMENYLHNLRIKGENHLRLVKVDTFSSKSLVNFNKINIFKEILENKTPINAMEALKKS